MTTSFKAKYIFKDRNQESTTIRQKYPNRIPIIVEKAENAYFPEIDRKKYLVPTDLTIGQFIYVLRKRIKIAPEQAIFIFLNNTIPPNCSLMSQIYKEHKDDDGFLYATVACESTYG